MKKFNAFSWLLAGSIGLFAVQSCTDLKVEQTDSTLNTGAGGGSAVDPVAFLSSAYSDLGNYTDQENIYALLEHPTDEMMGPTRGTDWGDNGIWRTLHTHNWDATHAFVLNSWNQINSAAYKCNEILAATGVTAEQVAQAKFLRAWNMWYVMDLWGQVPFRNTTDGVDVNPRVYTRSEAFDFIEKDLKEALPDLPTIGPTAGVTTASKAAANALLARMYLNKHIYEGTAVDNNDMQACINACDAVNADGYTLEPSYFDNFQPGASREIILTSSAGTGAQRRNHMTLHYDQNPSGWNGFVVLSDFYDKFDAADSRRGKANTHNGPTTGVDYGFLIGDQYGDDGKVLTNSRNGLPLSFSKDCRIAGAASDKGIRCIKYHKQPGTPEYANYILLRYADVLTMKAEAQFRKGDNAAGSATIKTLTDLRGGKPVTSLDGMLDERGRELYWEGIRRTDLIRFGKFAEVWQEKSVTDANRALFPIPQAALDSNPNLQQNPGY